MTRKLSLLIPAFLGLCFALAPVSFAQSCAFSCPGVWGPTQAHLISLPGGCEVTVYFTTRTCLPFPWQDVKILAVDQVLPPDESCLSYAAMDTKDFLALITDKMLVDNPMGFPPNPPTPPSTENCDSNWRVVQNACWQKSMHYEYEPTMEPLPLWQPCDAVDCCLKRYTVCVNACGDRTVTETSRSTPVQSCSQTGSYPCTSVCD